jgi:hypothetical protein
VQAVRQCEIVELQHGGSEWFQAPAVLHTEIGPFVPLKYEARLAPKCVWRLEEEKYLAHTRYRNTIYRLYVSQHGH